VNDYFSDRENGPRARTEQAISPAVWAGLVATVQALITAGPSGCVFPSAVQMDKPFAVAIRMLWPLP
jgi:hypothetical protein